MRTGRGAGKWEGKIPVSAFPEALWPIRCLRLNYTKAEAGHSWSTGGWPLRLHDVDEQSEGYIAALLRSPPAEFSRKLNEAQRAREAVLARLLGNSDS